MFRSFFVKGRKQKTFPPPRGGLPRGSPGAGGRGRSPIHSNRFKFAKSPDAPAAPQRD